MTAQMVLDTLKTQGIEIKAENGKIFARPPVPEHLKAEIKTHKTEIITLLSPPSDLALSHAYRKYWNTPQDASMATFQAILAEIAILEARLDPVAVVRILEAEAQRFHRETGRCPHCRQAGPLHQEPAGHDEGRR